MALPDHEWDRWRGTIDEKVRAHGQHLGAINGDLREMWKGMGALHDEMVEIRGQVIEARTEASEAMSHFNQAREEDWVELRQAHKEALKDQEVSKWAIFYKIIVPILVAVMAGLIIYALTVHP